MIGLNLEMDMGIQFEDSTKISKVGITRISKIWVNGDGSGTIQIVSSTSYVDMDMFNEMSNHSDEDIDLYFKFEYEAGAEEE